MPRSRTADSSSRFARGRRLVRFVLRTAVKAFVYCLSLVVPRDENLWIFGCNGGARFAENSKYCFLHTANEHSDDVRAVWLSRRWDLVGELRERGYEAYHIDTPRGTAVALRAGTAFITHSLNDVGMAGALGARVVNLWHGIPLKRVSLDDHYYLERMDVRTRCKTRFLYWFYDYTVTTAARLSSKFASAFATDKRNVVALGYPRNDALFADKPGSAVGSNPTIHARLRELRAENDLVAYVPTWRETGGNPIADADLNLAALDDFLARRDAVLVLKFHPNTEVAFDDGAFDRIIELPSELDLHATLRDVDCLVTDYSSVYFDFLLLDRPVVFFPYDRETYRRRDREFYFEYDDVTPGPVATDGDELRSALAAALDTPGKFAAERARVRDSFFDRSDGNAGERVYRFVRARSAAPSTDS